MARPVFYPFADLAVGDSFNVLADSVKLASLRVYASRRGRELGRCFHVRDDSAAGFYRVVRKDDADARHGSRTPLAGRPTVVKRETDDFYLHHEGWAKRP